MRKNEGREHTLLSKIYGSNTTFQGQIARFKRLGGLGREKPKNKEEEMKGASARETLAWVLNPSSAPWILAPRSAPRPMAPRSAPRSVAPTSAPGSVAPTYLPRQRHLDAMFFTARHLGAKTYCAETCYLGAVGHGADPQGLKINLRRLEG